MKRKYFIEFNDDANHAIQYLTGMAKDTRQVTLKLLSGLTQAEIDWQYDQGWNTIGALFDHITAIEHFFRIEFIEDRKLSSAEHNLWEAALDMGEHLPKLIGVKTIEDYKQALIESGEMFYEALNKIEIEQFSRRRIEFDDLEGSNLAWILYHKVEDEIYHRGQISMIKKLYKSRI